MKIILTSLVIIILLSCGNKTKETSKYAIQISELETIMNEVENNYFQFLDYSLDSLLSIKKNAPLKYNKALEYYNYDSVDMKTKEILKTFKVQMIKRLKRIENQHQNIVEEFEFSKKQISDLTPKLTHEEFSKEDSEKYYAQEKNALLDLNRKINTYNGTFTHLFKIKDRINFQLDSLINNNVPVN